MHARFTAAVSLAIFMPLSAASLTTARADQLPPDIATQKQMVGCWNIGRSRSLSITARGGYILYSKKQWRRGATAKPQQAHWLSKQLAYEFPCRTIRPLWKHGARCQIRVAGRNRLEVSVFKRPGGRQWRAQHKFFATRCKRPKPHHVLPDRKK